MRASVIILGIVFFCSLAVACQQSQKEVNYYFSQQIPDDTPAVFAPGTISKEDRYEQFLLFSPDGQELTFGVTNPDWSKFTLYHMVMEDGRWSEPKPAPFLGEDQSALTSCLSFGMDRAFITSSRPSYPPCDIWMSERRDGGWSEPVKLEFPISSEGDEFEVHISRSGTLYFSSSREGGLGDLDIYRAPLVDGGYPNVENLGPPINTSSGDDLPYIAPDESYLIFASNRPGGLGSRDLYISFYVDGAWSEPVNLGSPINSEYFDIYPSISPDGKYFFFTRRKSWQTDEDSDIYWVSAGFIDRLKRAVSSGADDAVSQ